MLTKSSNYILHLHGQLAVKPDVIGTLAAEYVKLRNNEVPLPDAFVITGYAFDDFLTSAGIIDDISEYLMQLDGSPENAQEVSDKIGKLIVSSNYPALVLNPILQAYKNISGFTDKYTTIRPSWIIPSELEPDNFTRKFTLPGIKGDAALLYAIKQIWASLFSAEALLERYRTAYDGELSISVMIQKEVQAEIFGELYYPTEHPSYDSNALAEVTALLGMPHDYKDYAGELLEPDIYLIDANTNTLLEKHVTVQKHMYLRKTRTSRALNQEELFKVEISKEWQKRQKLDDGYVQDLAFIAKHAADLLDGVIELEWAFEGGKLYILHIRRITDIRFVANDLEHLQEDVEEALVNHADGIVDHDPHQQQWEIVPESAKPLDFDSLAKEVESLSQELAFELEFEEPEAIYDPVQVQIEKQDFNKKANLKAYDLNTKLYLDVSDLSASELHHAQEFSGAYYDATKMIVNYKLLPESVFADKSTLKQLLEDYAADISTVAKVMEPKSIFYSFSNLKEDHYTQLSAQNMFSPDVSGSERFVMKPEALLAEVMAVKKARNEMAKRNINLVLPYLRSYPELVTLKKILNKEGIRSTHTQQLWVELSTPALLHELEHFDSKSVDGFIVDLSQLLVHMTGRREVIERDLNTVFSALRNAFNNKAFRMVFKLKSDELLVKKLAEYKFFPEGLILTTYPEASFLRAVSKSMSDSTQNLKVRQAVGRPQKSLW